MSAYRYVLLLFVFCFSAFFGWGKQICAVHVSMCVPEVAFRQSAPTLDSWRCQKLAIGSNKYGFKLERLTVARSGVVLDKPEVLLLAGELKPAESDSSRLLYANSRWELS